MATLKRNTRNKAKAKEYQRLYKQRQRFKKKLEEEKVIVKCVSVEADYDPTTEEPEWAYLDILAKFDRSIYPPVTNYKIIEIKQKEKKTHKDTK